MSDAESGGRIERAGSRGMRTSVRQTASAIGIETGGAATAHGAHQRLNNMTSHMHRGDSESERALGQLGTHGSNHNLKPALAAAERRQHGAKYRAPRRAETECQRAGIIERLRG